MKKSIKLLSVAFVIAVIMAISSVWALAAPVPEKPGKIIAESDYKSITLKWDQCEDVNGYRVYQYVDNKWKSLKTTSVRSYTVTDLVPNTTYKFSVRSYIKENGENYWSDYKTVYATTLGAPESPAKINVDAGFDSVTLSWDAVENANGYRVYQSVGGKWKALKTTSAKTYTVTGLTDATDYKFAVKSYAKIDGVTYWASSYTKVSARTLGAPEKPAKVTAKKNDSVVILSWDECLNATGYKVYQSVSGKWKVIGDVADTSFAVENLSAATSYKFAVKPYLVADGVTYNAKSYTTLSVKTEKADVLNFRNQCSYDTWADLYWNKSSSADGYEIYKKVDGEWQLIEKENKYITGTSISNLEVANTYEFAIRSFIKNGDKVYWSNYSAITVTTSFDKPEAPSIALEADTVTAYWNDDYYVDGYRIYIKEKGGSWQKVKDVKQGVEECQITDLKANTTYYVALKAYAKTSTGTKWSALSSSRTIIVGDYTKTSITSAEATAEGVTLSWVRVPDAKGYRIYNKVGNKWTALKTVTSTTYTLTGLESDTVYNLAVRAYKKVDGVTSWYDYSETKKIITVPSEKDLTGGRYEKFRDFLYDSDYSLDFRYYETSGSSAINSIESKLAFKGEDFYIGGWYYIDRYTDIFYDASADRIYSIHNSYNMYTYQKGYGDATYELIAEYLYSTGFYYHDYEIKSCISEYRGQPAVCEYFIDESGVKTCTYYILDEYVGTEIFGPDYKEGARFYRCELTNIDTTPSSSLFKVPSGYEYVKAE